MTTRLQNETHEKQVQRLQAEVAQLSARLVEAEETIYAIENGLVDAFVLGDSGESKVYTLEGADRPYRLFVEQVQQGVATLHDDGTIVYCNLRVADLLKVPHEKVIGAALKDFIDPADHPIYEALLAQGRTASGQGEARLVPSEGKPVSVLLNFSVLPKDCGALIGVFITDLTFQKYHETLAAAQRTLQEADRRKNEFLALLAHELRNPLATIRNAVSIMRKTRGDAASIDSTCGMLERQVSHMVRLVDDLLDVSRITRNKIELRKEKVDLNSVIAGALEIIRPVCKNLRHELEVALPSAPVHLYGDPVRLTQVFANLLDNACKYMEEGGHVSVRIEAPGAGEGPAGDVVIRIKDRGIGIAPDQLSRIFDMFAQVDTSLERPRGGLGIGLTLVASLVELHGGRVEAHSDGPGKGSEFVVRLPAHTESTDEAPSRSKETRTGRRYRILVVDDNRDSVESLALLLKLMGHETHTALDGEQAVEAASKIRPDVVLLDLGMPKMNGYDACRLIRAESWAKTMTLLAQTGWGQEEDRRRTEEAGFDGHLVKPVDPDALLSLIASLEARRRS